MQEKENIEELFRDVFKNYEEPVKPELWSKVSEAINAPSAPVDPSQGLGQAATSASSGITGSITAYVAGAILLVGGATGIYLMSNNTDVQPSSPKAEVVNELMVPVEEVISNNEVSEETRTESSASVSENSIRIQNNDNVRDEQITAESKKLNSGSVEEPADRRNPVSINEQTTAINTIQESAQKSSEQVKNTAPSSSDPVGETTAIVEKAETESISDNNINPNMLFEPFPTSGLAPLTVKFETADNLDKVEWNFGDGASSRQTGTLEHTFESPGTYNVVLKHFTTDGRMINKQVSIEVLSDLEIQFIPNIFSPNGDGSNDIFTFEASHLSDYEVTLFDQNGKKVHSWKKVNAGWDGRLNSGKEAKEGTYFYVIFATGENGHHNTQSGILQLIR